MLAVVPVKSARHLCAKLLCRRSAALEELLGGAASERMVWVALGGGDEGA